MSEILWMHLLEVVSLRKNYIILDPAPNLDDFIKKRMISIYLCRGDLPNSVDEKLMARVRRKISIADGNTNKSYNPILDSSTYKVEFSDGATDEVAANIIAECVLSKDDSEGHHYQILKEILDHKRDGSAIPVSDGFHVRKKSLVKIPKKTTLGWSLLVEWRDGSTYPV